MKIYLESKDQIVEKRTDGRGRFNLGTRYADKEIVIAILDVGGCDESEE